MDKLIELLKQIQDLAGVAIDALSEAAGGGKPEGGKPPQRGEGGPPPPDGGGGPPPPDGGGGPPPDEQPPRRG